MNRTKLIEKLAALIAANPGQDVATLTALLTDEKSPLAEYLDKTDKLLDAAEGFTDGYVTVAASASTFQDSHFLNHKGSALWNKLKNERELEGRPTPTKATPYN